MCCTQLLRRRWRRFSIFFHFTHFKGNINSSLELQGDIFLSFDDDAMPLNILPLPMPCYGRLYTTCFITTTFSPHQIDTKFAFLEKCLLVQLHYGLYLILMEVFDIEFCTFTQNYEIASKISAMHNQN